MGKKLSDIVEDVYTKDYWYRLIGQLALVTDMDNSKEEAKSTGPTQEKRLADPL